MAGAHPLKVGGLPAKLRGALPTENVGVGKRVVKIINVLVWVVRQKGCKK
jgi:hypothetical protein